MKFYGDTYFDHAFAAFFYRAAREKRTQDPVMFFVYDWVCRRLIGGVIDAEFSSIGQIECNEPGRSYG